MKSNTHKIKNLEIALEKILAFVKQGNHGESDSMPQGGTLGIELIIPSQKSSRISASTQIPSPCTT